MKNLTLHLNRYTFLKKMSVLTTATILAGCSMAPIYERPVSPMSEHYPTGEAYPGRQVNNGKQTVAADIGWRDFYTDPVLLQLIDHALKNNHDFKVTALNVEAIEAQYRIRRADRLPHVSVTAESASQRLPSDLAYNPRMYQVGVTSVAWEVDLWGRVRSLSDQALQNYLASKEVQTASQLSLVSAVANAYLVYKADQETLGLTKATLATQQKSYDLTRKLVDVGNATRFDLRQAEIGLRTAQTNYAKFLRITAQDRNALVLLLGSPLTQELAVQLDQSPKIPDQVVMQDIPVGLPSDLLQRRPDIRAAEHKLQAANANIGAARAAFFPSITLTGSAGTASSSLDNLFNAGTGAWSFMPKINLPIFSAGLNQANLDRSHIMKQIEVINYDKSIQTAFREVADGLAGKSTLDEQIKSQQQMIAASQDAHKLATLRFDAGEDNYLAVLDSQRTLYASQQALIQTRLERLNNQVNLYKALGGGWNEHTVQIERKSLK